MKQKRYTESQIISILNEAETGVPVKDILRKHGISPPTFYKWKSKYGGMSVSELKRMREIEEENRRLKKMYAELSLVHEALKDAVEKKL